MRSRLAVVCLALAALTGARQNSPSCDAVDTCRQLAIEAASRGDYETFHDFAWLTVRRGRPNDPDLMYLLARAQSLSGRPHDALVMLRRLAGLGVPTDAETHEDFRRVRALPGWPEVSALLENVKAGETSVPSAPAVAEIASALPVTKAPEVVGTSSASAPPVREPLTIARLSFAPVGLAYDAVSRRFIVGDRRANKLMVLDEEFRRVNDLAAAASAGFFGLTAVEIDRHRGDLWVANAKDDGSETALHRLQLISGRVLQVLPLPAAHGPATFMDMALTRGGTVLALDTRGKRLFTLRAGSYQRPLPIDGDALLSIAALDEDTAWIATTEGLLRVDLVSDTAVPVRAARNVSLTGFVHIRAHQGAILGIQPDGDRARIVRLNLDGAGVKAIAATLVAEVAIADPTSVTIDGGTLHYLGRDPDGGATVRHISLDRSR